MCTSRKEEGRKDKQDCRKRNLVYQTTCHTCRVRKEAEIEERYKEEGKKKVEEMKKGMKKYVYIGETNRSVYERGREHHNDIAANKTSSHMLRHLLDVHEEEEEDWDKVKFSMKILRSTQTAFKRQILESCLIQKERKGHYLMNAKSEYNRCALPRLTAKLGERELEKWREQDKQETIKEASLEEKIRNRKKAKTKERGAANRRRDQEQPARKRRRVEPTGEADCIDGDIPPQEEEEKRQIPPKTPQKRKVAVGEREMKNPKRMRRIDIRGYITCKKWRIEEEQATATEEGGPGHDQQQGN